MAHGNYQDLNRNRYLYNGKELQDAVLNGNILGLYDFGSRYYNPTLGRWFNIDPALQVANPYLYAANFPMMYLDPDGEFWHLIIGAVIGGIINWATNGAEFNAKGLAAFGIGAVAGSLSAGIGAGISASYAGAASFGAGFWGTAAGAGSTGFFAGAAAGATNGFITGFGNSLMQGQGFGNSLASGFMQAGLQGVGGGLTGGIIGGIDAWTKGTNFFTGTGNFDISKGIGAHNFDPASAPNNTVTGKYVGKYERVNVYESSVMNGGGISIPERGIFVDNGVFSNAMSNSTGRELQLLQHEFGHVLQYRKIGPVAYYSTVGVESLASATFDPSNHSTRWMETWANYMSNDHFGSKYISNPVRFPVQNISKFHQMRIRSVLFNTGDIYRAVTITF